MWADNYIEKLRRGETVSFRPRGDSMTPKIYSGQLVTVEPIGRETFLKDGDIVLCKVAGSQYLHLISAVGSNDCFQISNNHGKVNGWCHISNIFGRLTKVSK